MLKFVNVYIYRSLTCLNSNLIMQAAAMFKVMKDTPPIPETLSPDGKDFLRCCFKRNPAERPTAAVLLEHRFLKNSQQPDVTATTQLYNGTSFMVNITFVPLLN